MLTVQALSDLGANTREGLGRCLNNETFYLRLVNMALDDGGYDKLENALNARDTHAAFEAAHALKGVLGNLSLTPLYAPVSELTELLRQEKTEGTEALLQQLKTALAQFKALR